MTTVLVVNHEALSDRMAGTTIRNWELAGVLASENDVTLAVPSATSRTHPRVAVASYARNGLEALVAAHEVVVCSGYLLERFPSLLAARRLVIDLYDPFPLENLHMHPGASLDQQYRIATSDRSVLARLTRAGDAFLCASERQRDFWSGWLLAVGRVNPYTHAADPGLTSMLMVVPFGVEATAPVPAPPMFRGVVPGIADGDFIVLWGGGIWNWFDPLTLIRAAGLLRDELPRLRVLFPAPTSPSDQVLPMRMADEARRLAEELGLVGIRVFFGESWVPYANRGGMLLEADVGVSLHQDDVETRYSFRTRVLDYLWAGLPVITTEGDSLADLVAAEDLGAVAPYGDVAAVAAAIRSLAEDAERRASCGRRASKAAEGLRWAQVAAPLVAYCRDPRPAADRAAIRAEPGGVAPHDRPSSGARARRLLGRAWSTLRQDGPGALLTRSRAYLRRRS